MQNHIKVIRNEEQHQIETEIIENCPRRTETKIANPEKPKRNHWERSFSLNMEKERKSGNHHGKQKRPHHMGTRYGGSVHQQSHRNHGDRKAGHAVNVDRPGVDVFSVFDHKQGQNQTGSAKRNRNKESELPAEQACDTPADQRPE